MFMNEQTQPDDTAHGHDNQADPVRVERLGQQGCLAEKLVLTGQQRHQQNKQSDCFFVVETFQ